MTGRLRLWRMFKKRTLAGGKAPPQSSDSWADRSRPVKDTLLTHNGGRCRFLVRLVNIQGARKGPPPWKLSVTREPDVSLWVHGVIQPPEGLFVGLLLMLLVLDRGQEAVVPGLMTLCQQSMETRSRAAVRGALKCLWLLPDCIHQLGLCAFSRTWILLRSTRGVQFILRMIAWDNIFVAEQSL